MTAALHKYMWAARIGHLSNQRIQADWIRGGMCWRNNCFCNLILHRAHQPALIAEFVNAWNKIVAVRCFAICTYYAESFALPKAHRKNYERCITASFEFNTYIKYALLKSEGILHKQSLKHPIMALSIYSCPSAFSPLIAINAVPLRFLDRICTSLMIASVLPLTDTIRTLYNMSLVFSTVPWYLLFFFDSCYKNSAEHCSSWPQIVRRRTDANGCDAG